MSLQRLAAVSCASAALLAAAGFTALGSVFAYPQILREPTDEILALYRAHPGAVGAWFGVLVVAAALLVPAAVALGRLAGGRRGRWIVGVGVAAAVVQVIGLSRWLLFVPGLSREATDPVTAAEARGTFETLHFWLGQIVGETLGYALTAAFTVLVAVGLTRRLARLGSVAAALIATGVLVAPGVEIASLTNFVGYVLWCVWLLALSFVLVSARTAATAPRSSGRR